MEEHRPINLSASQRAAVMLRGPDGMPVGGGLLARDRLVITCAHVVNAALGRNLNDGTQPEAEVTLCFPFFEQAQVTARVVAWWPRGCGDGGLQDLVVLHCDGIPERSEPLAPVKVVALESCTFKAMGFPAAQPAGAWLHATIQDALPDSLHQFEHMRGRKAQPGFSGCPALEAPHGEVVLGLVVDADSVSSDALGLLIPSRFLLQALDTVAEALHAPRPGLPQGNWRSLVPPLPPTFVPRPAVFELMKAAVLDASGEAAVLVGARAKGPGAAVAVGMGGVGKTLLAIALAHDPDVRARYPDGVVWVALGQTPDLMRLVGVVAGALGEPLPDLQHPREARGALAGWFRDRACLLVLDDVWNVDHLLPFDAMGGHARLLVTTRSLSLASTLGERAVRVDLLESRAALEVLAKAAGVQMTDLPPEATEVANECGRLPLALAMAGGMARDGAYAWAEILARFKAHDLARIRQRIPDYPHPDLYSMVEVGVQALGPAHRQMYLDFCVFQEDTPAPMAALTALWGARGFDADTCRDFARLLEERSLARRVGEDGLQLHDIQYDFVMHEASDQPARHARLIEGYRAFTDSDWASGPRDGYFFEHLPRHLREAGRAEELDALLLSARWLLAKVDACGIDACMADFESLQLGAGHFRGTLLHALRLSAGAVRARPDGLAEQLLGRLLGVADPSEALQNLLTDLRACVPTGTLLPLNACLTPPGGAELFALVGHTDEVHYVALTEDGKRAVSASGDGALRVWDLEAGKCIHTLEGHSECVEHVALTGDDQSAVSASLDNTLRVWDLQSGECLQTLEGHTDWVEHVAVTGDGKRAVSASNDGTLRVWDIVAGACIQTLEGHTVAVYHVALTGDGKRAVSASGDGTLRVWDIEAGVFLYMLDGHTREVYHVALTGDNKRAVSASDDNSLRVWDIEAGVCLHTLEGHTGGVTYVALTGDGKCAVSTSYDDTLRVWDLEAGVCLHTLEGHTDGVLQVTVTGDGGRAVSASWDNDLRLWDLKSGECLQTFEGHTDWVRHVALTGDGKRAVSASEDRSLRVWDFEAGECLRTLEGHTREVLHVALTGDGKRAVSASDDGTLRVWDLEAGVCLQAFEGHTRGIQRVALTCDGKCAVSASSDGTLRVWDIEAGVFLYTLDGHTREVYHVALTGDNKRAVSASDDNSLRVWDIEAGVCLQTLEGHTGGVTYVALTGDGKCAVSTSYDATLRVWDLESGVCLHTLEGHTEAVLQVTVTGDGGRAVSASWENDLRLWDLKSGECLQTFEGHTDWVRHLALTGDGKRAVSASDDGTLRVWDIEAGECIRTLEGHTDEIRCMALTGDGKRAVFASDDNTLRVWDLEAEAAREGSPLLAVYTMDAAVCAVAIGPDDCQIVAGDAGGRVAILRFKA